MTSATPPGQCTTVLHDDNIRMRKLHELFRYECDIAMRKATLVPHDAPRVVESRRADSPCGAAAELPVSA